MTRNTFSLLMARLGGMSLAARHLLTQPMSEQVLQSPNGMMRDETPEPEDDLCGYKKM